MRRTTGGCAWGATSTRSSSRSCASARARSMGTMPNASLVVSSNSRTCGMRIWSLIRSSRNAMWSFSWLTKNWTACCYPVAGCWTFKEPPEGEAVPHGPALRQARSISPPSAGQTGECASSPGRARPARRTAWPRPSVPLADREHLIEQRLDSPCLRAAAGASSVQRAPRKRLRVAQRTDLGRDAGARLPREGSVASVATPLARLADPRERLDRAARIATPCVGARLQEQEREQGVVQELRAFRKRLGHGRGGAEVGRSGGEITRVVVGFPVGHRCFDGQERWIPPLPEGHVALCILRLRVRSSRAQQPLRRAARAGHRRGDGSRDGPAGSRHTRDRALHRLLKG